MTDKVYYFAVGEIESHEISFGDTKLVFKGNDKHKDMGIDITNNGERVRGFAITNEEAREIANYFEQWFEYVESEGGE